MSRWPDDPDWGFNDPIDWEERAKILARLRDAKRTFRRMYPVPGLDKALLKLARPDVPDLYDPADDDL